jgi:hypothetical protein
MTTKKKRESGEVFTGYCTKWCLTRGIFEAPFEVCASTSGDTMYGKQVRGGYAFCVIGKDVFETREEAEARARKIAERKIAAVKKQLDELEVMAVIPKWDAP